MQVQGDPRLEPMSRNRMSIPGDFFHGMLQLAALVPPGYTSMFIWHHQQNPGSAPQNQGSPAPDPDSTLYNPSVTTVDDSSQFQSLRGNPLDGSLSSISGSESSDTFSVSFLESTVPDTWAQFLGCVHHLLSPLLPADHQDRSVLSSQEGSFGGGVDTTLRFCGESMNSNGGTEWSF